MATDMIDELWVERLAILDERIDSFESLEQEDVPTDIRDVVGVDDVWPELAHLNPSRQVGKLRDEPLIEEVMLVQPIMAFRLPDTPTNVDIVDSCLYIFWKMLYHIFQESLLILGRQNHEFRPSSPPS